MKTSILKLMVASLLFFVATAGAASDDKPPCCREPLVSGPATDKSLYQLDSVWTSDVGKEVKLGVLRGRPQVLALFFTSCEFACPIIVQDMKSIQEALPVELRKQVDFVLVTMDCERDSPAVLREYRRRQNLGTDHWTLLRGAPDDVRELAALLGVNYQKDARGQFSHSNVITVLNAEGEIVFRQTGLSQPPAGAVRQISHAVATVDGKGKPR